MDNPQEMLIMMAKMMPKSFIEEKIAQQLDAIKSARLINDTKAEKRESEKLATECLIYYTKLSTEGKSLTDVIEEHDRVEKAVKFFDNDTDQKKN